MSRADIRGVIALLDRRSPEFIHFRERLQAAGKSVKAAIIATARKLVVTLNAMLASGTDYRPAAGV